MLGILSVSTLVLSIISVSLVIYIILNHHAYGKMYRDMKYSNAVNDERELRVNSNFKNETLIANEFNKLILRIKDIRKLSDTQEKELRIAIENMSHDLRTPLTSIKGYLSLIKEKDDLGEEEKAECYKIIEKKIASLEQLIGGFYDLSRLQNNDYKMYNEVIRLENVLFETIASNYEAFERVGIEPELNVEEDLPAVYADPFAVDRIFGNIITNAIKYSDGDLRISAYFDKRSERIITEFRNKAEKVTAGEAKRLTERFFTVDRARTGQSTGIGLALVDSLLQNMNNSIDCEKEGDDIVFTIRWNINK